MVTQATMGVASPEVRPTPFASKKNCLFGFVLDNCVVLPPHCLADGLHLLCCSHGLIQIIIVCPFDAHVNGLCFFAQHECHCFFFIVLFKVSFALMCQKSSAS